jgi:hypothetical protein
MTDKFVVTHTPFALGTDKHSEGLHDLHAMLNEFGGGFEGDIELLGNDGVTRNKRILLGRWQRSANES